MKLRTAIGTILGTLAFIFLSTSLFVVAGRAPSHSTYTPISPYVPATPLPLTAEDIAHEKAMAVKAARDLAEAESNTTLSTVAPQPATQSQSAPDASVRVWVNTNTGVYHYPGSRYYGNTKQGEYMNPSEASAHGYSAAERR